MDINILNINIENIDILLLIAVMIVAIFSTFFMWKAYISLLIKEKNSPKSGKIEKILIKKTIENNKFFFNSFLKAPVFIALFILLLIIPAIFSFNVTIFIFLFLIILYFWQFPQIIEIIKRKSTVTLKDYLNVQNPESENSLSIFKDVWEVEDLDLKKRFNLHHLDVWKIFITKINKLQQEDSIPKIQIYLDDFAENIDKRSVLFLTNSLLLSSILEWHFDFIEKKFLNFKNKKDKKFNYHYIEIINFIELIFLMTMKRALESKNAFVFFQEFKAHINNKKEKIYIVNGEELYYLKLLFLLFFVEFYKVIKTLPVRDRKKIWEKYFSEEWKITEENLRDDKNIITNIAFNVFLHWSQERIWEDKEEELDQEIATISKYLFPGIDFIMWDRILIFILTPRTSKNKVKSAIERPWNFGFAEEKYLNYYKGSSQDVFIKQKNKKIDKTIDLVFFLFPDYFTKKKLERYIKNLKNLKYKDNSKESYKKLQLLIIFKRMFKKTSAANFINAKVSEDKSKQPLHSELSKSLDLKKRQLEIQPTYFSLTIRELFGLSYPVLKKPSSYKKLKSGLTKSFLLKNIQKKSLPLVKKIPILPPVHDLKKLKSEDKNKNN